MTTPRPTATADELLAQVAEVKAAQAVLDTFDAHDVSKKAGRVAALTALDAAEDALFFSVAYICKRETGQRLPLARNAFWSAQGQQKLIDLAEALATGAPAEWILAFNG